MGVWGGVCVCGCVCGGGVVGECVWGGCLWMGVCVGVGGGSVCGWVGGRPFF